MSLNAETKEAIVAEYEQSEVDTGSKEVQVALITASINN
ncbi:30S ribosomal protein S15, partial [Vibrio parahaemolyticus]|nr:30S ribosomal protein S15 [Vibrio parahaemolyticus]